MSQPVLLQSANRSSKQWFVWVPRVPPWDIISESFLMWFCVVWWCLMCFRRSSGTHLFMTVALKLCPNKPPGVFLFKVVGETSKNWFSIPYYTESMFLIEVGGSESGRWLFGYFLSIVAKRLPRLILMRFWWSGILFWRPFSLSLVPIIIVVARSPFYTLVKFYILAICS